MKYLYMIYINIMIYSLYKQNYNVFSSKKVAIQFFNFLAVFVSNISFLECLIYLSKLICSFYSSILSPIWFWMLCWASLRIRLMFLLCFYSLLLTFKIFSNFWIFFGMSKNQLLQLISREPNTGGTFFIWLLESHTHYHSISFKIINFPWISQKLCKKKIVAEPHIFLEFLSSEFFSLSSKNF